MEKLYTAIGNFYNEEGTELIDVPADEEAIYAAVDKIVDSYAMGDIISDEDMQVLRAYLPAIGTDEASQDDNYSLQGKGEVTKNASGCGIEVHAEGHLDVESRWEQHHFRKQWTGNMRVKREGGDAQVKELSFTFRYFAIGVDEEARFYVQYSATYHRNFNDPYHLADFNEGGTAQASRCDISKGIQWGFYMRCTCGVRTDQGTLLV